MSGQKYFTVLSLHISNIYAKKKGIPKKFFLTLRAMKIFQEVDLVAGDFHGTTWWRRSKDNLTTVGTWIHSGKKKLGYSGACLSIDMLERAADVLIASGYRSTYSYVRLAAARLHWHRTVSWEMELKMRAIGRRAMARNLRHPWRLGMWLSWLRAGCCGRTQSSQVPKAPWRKSSRSPVTRPRSSSWIVRLGSAGDPREHVKSEMRKRVTNTFREGSRRRRRHQSTQFHHRARGAGRIP